MKTLKKHVFSISRRPDLPGILPTGQLPGSSRARKNQIFGKEFELISFPFFLFLLEFFSCNSWNSSNSFPAIIFVRQMVSRGATQLMQLRKSWNGGRKAMEELSPS